MANRNGSAAYDFSRFEVKPEETLAPQKESEQSQTKIIEMPKEQTKKGEKIRKRNRAIRVATTCSALAFLFLICGIMVFSQVRLTELTEELNKKNAELTESQSLYTQLQMKTKAQMPLTTVDNYAKEKLGMGPANQDQYIYVKTVDGDKGEKLQPTGSNWFTSVWSWIVGLLS